MTLHFNFYQNWSSTVEAMIKICGVFLCPQTTQSLMTLDDLGGDTTNC